MNAVCVCVCVLRTESSLPAGKEVPVLQPMATAPLRTTQSPAVSVEALPTALVLVDILQACCHNIPLRGVRIRVVSLGLSRTEIDPCSDDLDDRFSHAGQL